MLLIVQNKINYLLPSCTNLISKIWIEMNIDLPKFKIIT